MRIALVCDWYPPRRGGIESHLSELGRRLVAAGHEVHVVTSTRGDSTAGDGGVTVHRVDAALLPRFELLYTLRGIRSIGKTLDSISPDVVHAHVSIVSPAAFAGARHAQKQRMPTVLTFHSFIPATPLFMRGAALLTGSRGWDAVFTAVSQRVAREVAPIAGRRPVVVLPNAVDVEFWRPSPRPPTDTTFSIVSALRLNSKKRPFVLIDLAAYLRDRADAGRNFTISIAGSGPMHASLSHAIYQRRLEDHVRLVGHINREALQALYASADVFVLPTVRESFGLAALEARSTGLPVIAMKESALAEQIVNGENGLLAESDRDFFGCVLRMINDRLMHEEITRRNRETPLDLGWPRCIRGHEMAYASAIELMTGPSQE